MTPSIEARNWTLRSMRPDDWTQVAQLIHDSTNTWYESKGLPPVFANGPTSTRLFCEVYEALDPGCCIVAEEAVSGDLIGSCFYHPRDTHVSLGIMNVSPRAFGRGIARGILNQIIQFADAHKKTVRLVSSAMNLNSFSLYNRAGFVPRLVFQDFLLNVPASGLGIRPDERVRAARQADAPAMAALEFQLCGIAREKDYRFILENAGANWHASIFETNGSIDGFLISISHPGANLIGPGVARTPQVARELLLAELDVRRGESPVFLVPADFDELVAEAYSWGARNCELHFAQVRGDWQPPRGVILPTFMPESG